MIGAADGLAAAVAKDDISEVEGVEVLLDDVMFMVVGHLSSTKE
jgi:hypothetical protein